MLATRSLSFLQSVIFLVLAAPAGPAMNPILTIATDTISSTSRRMFPPGLSVRAPARDRIGISAARPEAVATQKPNTDAHVSARASGTFPVPSAPVDARVDRLGQDVEHDLAIGAEAARD